MFSLDIEQWRHTESNNYGIVLHSAGYTTRFLWNICLLSYRFARHKSRFVLSGLLRAVRYFAYKFLWDERIFCFRVVVYSAFTYEGTSTQPSRSREFELMKVLWETLSWSFPHDNIRKYLFHTYYQKHGLECGLYSDYWVFNFRALLNIFYSELAMQILRLNYARWFNESP